MCVSRRAKAFFEKDVGPESILHSRAKTLAGIPNLLELDWISWRENGAHNFFSCVVILFPLLLIQTGR